MKTVFTILMLIPALVACKARQHDEAGLLSAGDEQTGSEELSAVGNYAVNCNTESSQGGDSVSKYVLYVRGAENPADESQPLLVSVDVVQNGTTNRLFSDVKGRGAVAENKSIFVGFENGVLTGEPAAGDGGKPAFAGVITLAGIADGLQVSCLAELLK